MKCNDSRLELHDVPVLLWILGLIFAGVGALIIFQIEHSSFMPMIFVVIGLGTLLFSSVLTITADRITRTLKLDYRSALRHTLKEISFGEIANINVERSVSHSKGHTRYTYRTVVMRKDGTVIPFRSYSSSGSGKKEMQAAKLRDFIGMRGFDSMPAGMLQAAPQSTEPEIHETGGVHWQIRQTMMGVSAGARWHSPDFKTPGAFLLVAQKPEGQASHGLLASVGSMIFKQTLSMFGFQADDTPGLDQAATLDLDPALEPHFMAYTNVPASARQRLNSSAVMLLANWAARYPLKQFQKASRFSQLVVLIGPNGVYLATLNLLQPEQVHELTALGTELVKSQVGSRVYSSAK